MESINRVDFMHSIDTGNIDYITAFMNYFDQLMGVYNTFTPFIYSTKIENSIDNVLILSMKFPDSSRMSEVLNMFDQESRIISVYQRLFRYNVHQISNDTVQLVIITER